VATLSLRCGDRTLPLGARTLVMGVLNVTPDSFSDGGAYDDVARAVAHAEAMIADGADIIDIGGESTRPGAAPVDVAVELARVVPAVEALVARGVRCLSVDTRRAEVARAALSAGASWVNDVDGLADPAMIGACTAADAVVVMHRRVADHDAREDHVDDDDVIATVIAHLKGRITAATAAGISRDRLVVDPGVGFGKTIAHNVALTRALGRIRDDVGAPAVLYGPSRKRFVGALAGRDDPRDRDDATLGAISIAVACGADIVRVHDVRGAKDALALADAVWRSRSDR